MLYTFVVGVATNEPWRTGSVSQDHVTYGTRSGLELDLLPIYVLSLVHKFA